MKLKKQRKIPRPFLVLPLLDESGEKMPKNPGLKLFTKTWPAKRNNNNNNNDNNDDGNSRPLTATLEKPTILDINFIGKIDMSTVRKEFLNISNLCRIPLTLTISRRTKTAVINRPLSLPSSDKPKMLNKKNKRPETSEDSWEDEDTTSIVSLKATKLAQKLVKRRPTDIPVRKKNPSAITPINDSNNNNKTFRIPRKRAVGKLSLNITSNTTELEKSTKLPEPCKTCGRPDQPERFHSHPVTPLKPTKKPEEPPRMKSTVQKPVAIKYQSKQNAEKKPVPPPLRKSSLPFQKLVHTPPNIGSAASSTDKNPSKSTSTPRIKSGGKRLLTCYICGREFGTASLPLHEPKCLQRWERENANLPSHLQKKVPPKPDYPLTSEEWNDYAWKTSQAMLIPCEKCGRTFLPDRLTVHQRSCKVEPVSIYYN